MVKALSEWVKVDAMETMKTTKSRMEWKTMTFNALKEQDIERERERERERLLSLP